MIEPDTARYREATLAAEAARLKLAESAGRLQREVMPARLARRGAANVAQRASDAAQGAGEALRNRPAILVVAGIVLALVPLRALWKRRRHKKETEPAGRITKRGKMNEGKVRALDPL